MSPACRAELTSCSRRSRSPAATADMGARLPFSRDQATCDALAVRAARRAPSWAVLRLGVDPMSGEHPVAFREKLRQGRICLGTVITFSDPTVTEALCPLLDFVWIDMEHNPLSLEAVQGHVMATKGSQTATLVRVP